MGTGHDAYCVADPLYFDSPSTTRGDDEDFALARGDVPRGWRRTSFDDWLVHVPAGASMPLQGWKVHASACLDDAEPVLAAAWDYCIARRIPFKFVRSRQLLLLRNAK